MCRRKFRYEWDKIIEVLAAVKRALDVAPMLLPTHERGIQLAQRYELTIYDGLIVAAALEACCDTLWSEDMHNGLVIDGRLTLRNPFVT